MQARYSELRTPYHQAGLSDPNILCEECESKFTPWDTYGFEVLGPPLRDDAIIRSSDGTPLAIPLNDVNHDLFSLFLLSVLWRASVSKLRFFHRIHLGSRHEARILELLSKKSAPPPGEYATALGTSLDSPYTRSIPQPEQCRDERKLVFNRIYFPGVFALIKTDRRDGQPFFHKCMLQRRKTNLVFCFAFDQSPYFQFFEGMMKQIRAIDILDR